MILQQVKQLGQTSSDFWICLRFPHIIQKKEIMQAISEMVCTNIDVIRFNVI